MHPNIVFYGEMTGALGAVSGLIGAILAFVAMKPEDIYPWVAMTGSVVFMVASVGIAIYHRVEGARQQEFSRWKQVRSKHSHKHLDQDDFDAI